MEIKKIQNTLLSELRGLVYLINLSGLVQISYTVSLPDQMTFEGHCIRRANVDRRRAFKTFSEKNPPALVSLPACGFNRCASWKDGHEQAYFMNLFLPACMNESKSRQFVTFQKLT